MDRGQRSSRGEDTINMTPEQSEPPGSKAMTRIGIYFSDREFTAAKSAFLADWADRGDCDTLAKWIAYALDQHAKRSAPQQTAARQRATGTASEHGTTRTFDLPTRTINNVRITLFAQKNLGRRESMSQWAGDAIHMAVQNTRRRCDGVLPAAPIRLPNRLAR